jgi:hypothetical protein
MCVHTHSHTLTHTFTHTRTHTQVVELYQELERLQRSAALLDTQPALMANLYTIARTISSRSNFVLAYKDSMSDYPVTERKSVAVQPLLAPVPTHSTLLQEAMPSNSSSSSSLTTGVCVCVCVCVCV